MPPHVPTGKIAAQRILDLAHEIGSDSNFSLGWIAEAARLLGLEYSTLHILIRKRRASVGLKTIDTVCRKLNCTIDELLEK